MPKPDFIHLSQIKRRAKELYEAGKFNKSKICELLQIEGMSLTRKTLLKWANDGFRQVEAEVKVDNSADIKVKIKRPISKKAKQKQEKQQEIAQARQIEAEKKHIEPIIRQTVEKTFAMNEQFQQKAVEEEQSLQPPEEDKQPEDNTDRQQIKKALAKRNAQEIDEIVNAITEDFVEEDKLRKMVVSTGILGLHRIRQILVSNKEYFSGTENKVGLQSAGHYLKLMQAYETVAGTLGLSKADGGVLNLIGNQQNNFQQNNTIQQTKNIKEDIKADLHRLGDAVVFNQIKDIVDYE
jgi:hypothetical protein